jgi:glutamate--cysteine ligase catalytic subunit
MSAEDMDLMTIDEIFNGKQYSSSEKFPGLIGLISIYMDTIDLQDSVRSSVSKYLSFISKRASGELRNAASWMRNFVVTHPDYKQDSKVSPKINYDLLDACVRIGRFD